MRLTLLALAVIVLVVLVQLSAGSRDRDRDSRERDDRRDRDGRRDSRERDDRRDRDRDGRRDSRERDDRRDDRRDSRHCVRSCKSALKSKLVKVKPNCWIMKRYCMPLRCGKGCYGKCKAVTRRKTVPCRRGNGRVTVKWVTACKCEGGRRS